MWKPCMYHRGSMQFAKWERFQGAWPRPHVEFGAELGRGTPGRCFLLPQSLVKALMGPLCFPRPWLESSLAMPQALVQIYRGQGQSLGASTVQDSRACFQTGLLLP